MIDEVEHHHILLVDDEPRNLKYFKKYLQKNGFAVKEAFSGEEAIAALELNKFDHVFTDMHMKNINGLNLARHIHRKYPDTSTHLMTGDISQPFHDYLETGILKNIIMKPYNFEQISKILLI